MISKIAPHTAVLLLNLGAPDTLQGVRPFLQSLFFDDEIIRLPLIPRWLVSHTISCLRHKKAQSIYQRLGGGSPLLKNTKDQEQALQDSLGGGFKVYTVMRHYPPKAQEVVSLLKKEKMLKRVILLPLYPQYSTTTTRSSFRDVKKILDKEAQGLDISEICCYPTENHWIQANVELTKNVLEKSFEYGKPLLVFSAHGLPQSIIDSGDPYAYQVEQTAIGITNQLKELFNQPFDTVVSYQSKVGPKKWLEPNTEDVIMEASKDERPVVVLPVSFVSDHSETIIELDQDYKNKALSHGCSHYARVPVVGTHPLFIQGLKELVLSSLNPVTPRPPFCPKNYSQCPCQF
ncbi:MAG TPA: ferrochelatase [Alphaproteobacteria bacterium]|nr:ferrochelatase [Alphaproteobacteria bacterium]